MADDAQKLLKRVERALREMNQPENPGVWFVRGVWQGIGWVLGSIAGIVLIGWVLSIFGVIPGLDVIAHFLQNAFDRARGL